MTTNPAIRLVEHPVAALTEAGWTLILLAALVATWWAAGRNLLWLDNNWGNGWKLLPTFWAATRMVALLVILAVDLWLLAGIVHTLG